MDFKIKGKSWAGNIYHQFESICQDVDDFMSKDTVRFVENQVQTVGMSVRRIYSNVVQDILPPSEDVVGPKAQSEDGEQVGIQDHVNSVTDTGTKPTRINEKQLSVNQNSVGSSRNSNESLPVEVDHTMQFTEPPNEDPSREAKTYRPPSENCGVEENITSEGHDKFPSVSAHGEELITIKQERRAFYHLKNWNGFSDDEECVSNMSGSGWLLETELPLFEDPASDENRSLSTPAVSSADKINEDNGSLMDPQLPSRGALGEDGNLCDSFLNKDESLDVSSSVQSPEPLFSYFSCDEGGGGGGGGEEEEEDDDDDDDDDDGEQEEKQQEEEIGDMSSTCSTSRMSSNTLEPTSANFIKKANNICLSHAESDGYPYNIYTQSSADADYETKAVDMRVRPDFLILESNGSSVPTSALADNNASTTDGSDFVVGSSESRHEQHYKDGQSRIAISPSETGTTYGSGAGISDLNLETIDLSPDVKHDDKSVVSNCNFVSAASHRKNFRYYKKLIQEAFTSRKRLSKEYEHLAILYGDIDKESSQHFRPRSVPSSPNTYVHALRTGSFQETCETEWELL